MKPQLATHSNACSVCLSVCLSAAYLLIGLLAYCLCVCVCAVADYSAGISVEQKPPPCCKKTGGFYSISSKDYTTVAPSEKLGMVKAAALRQMESAGATKKALAKVSLRVCGFASTAVTRTWFLTVLLNI